MSLPTDLAADLTNPADEIPDSQFVPEADPALDADPLADALGSTPAKESKWWIGVIVVVLGFGIIMAGISMSDQALGIISPLVFVGGIILLVGIILFFVL